MPVWMVLLVCDFLLFFFFIRVVLVGMVDGRRMGLGGFLHHAYVGTYAG